MQLECLDATIPIGSGSCEDNGMASSLFFHLTQKPLIVAHRGGTYPQIAGEQTPQHFEQAIHIGADLIEVDLRETADGVILCVHDPEYAGIPVAERTYSELKLACSKQALRVPSSLEELLEIAHGKTKLDLEIKRAGFENRVLKSIKSRFSPDQVILKSFEDNVVKTLKTLAPHYTAGLLLGVDKPPYGPAYRLVELFPERRLEKCSADFVSPHWQLVRFGFIRRMRRLGYPVLVWTLNDAPLIARFLKEADGVITDQVDLAMKLRAS